MTSLERLAVGLDLVGDPARARGRSRCPRSSRRRGARARARRSSPRGGPAGRCGACPTRRSSAYPRHSRERIAPARRADSVGGVDTRVERIVLETDRHRIVGDLTLPRDGYRSRLSDYLNQGEIVFIPLTDAEITPDRRRRRAGAARVHRGRPRARPARLPGRRRRPTRRRPRRSGRRARRRGRGAAGPRRARRRARRAPGTSEMNGPIRFGGKLTTATTSVPSSSARS